MNVKQKMSSKNNTKIRMEDQNLKNKQQKRVATTFFTLIFVNTIFKGLVHKCLHNSEMKIVNNDKAKREKMSS